MIIELAPNRGYSADFTEVLYDRSALRFTIHSLPAEERKRLNELKEKWDKEEEGGMIPPR